VETGFYEAGLEGTVGHDRDEHAGASRPRSSARIIRRHPPTKAYRIRGMILARGPTKLPDEAWSHSAIAKDELVSGMTCRVRSQHAFSRTLKKRVSSIELGKTPIGAAPSGRTELRSSMVFRRREAAVEKSLKMSCSAI